MPKTDPTLPIIVLIPAYQPDEKLVDLCRALKAYAIPTLVIDDGSGSKYKPFFDQAQDVGAVIGRHAVNLGKGRALKTGINIIMQRWPNAYGVVTADSDGQNTPEDIGRIMAAMREDSNALVLGARDFSKGTTPTRSWLGNTVTRHVYQFVAGIRCTDTQTGLRGLPAVSLPMMMQIAGERFEYEMNVLFRFREMNLNLREVPIQTIYFDNNRGSHFKTLRDASRIFSVIFRHVFVSVFSYLLDYVLYLLLLRNTQLPLWSIYALGSALGALFRIPIQYATTSKHKGGRISLARDALLALLTLGLGAALVELFGTRVGVYPEIVKLLVDTLFSLLQNMAQRLLSSRRKKKGAASLS